MVVGVGIDAVQISLMKSLLECDGGTFAKATFSEEERAAALASPNATERFAGLYAVKEAVFKAIAPQAASADFDLRKIRVEYREDGSPRVAIDAYLLSIMEQAGARSILISVTNEGDYATAIALAQTEEI